MLSSKDTSSREYWEWAANVWRLNHIRNLLIAENEKAQEARKPYSRGINPRVVALRQQQ